MFVLRIKKEFIFMCFGFIVFGILSLFFLNKRNLSVGAHETHDFIKYAEFNPTYEALEKAMREDIKSHGEAIEVKWIEVLACLGAKYGGNFKKYKEQDMNEIIKKLKNGEQISQIAAKLKNYDYYYSVYSAVLEEFVGNYKIKKQSKNASSDEEVWEEVYGLKAFSPIAKTFPFSHYDDFGAPRSYGYSRPHLGHDMMAATGTPVIAIESGTVEKMGWNQYGGWRVGIRSFDKKRYYYYAHLRKNKPFHCDLKEGATVTAGDVIGYVGKTGYSTQENVNNIDKSHLHWGLQLIFDESQKEGSNEIWVDVYAITKLLEKNKSAIIRNNDTKEFYRAVEFKDDETN